MGYVACPEDPTQHGSSWPCLPQNPGSRPSTLEPCHPFQGLAPGSRTHTRLHLSLTCWLRGAHLPRGPACHQPAGRVACPPPSCRDSPGPGRCRGLRWPLCTAVLGAWGGAAFLGLSPCSPRAWPPQAPLQRLLIGVHPRVQPWVGGGRRLPLLPSLHCLKWAGLARALKMWAFYSISLGKQWFKLNRGITVSGNWRRIFLNPNITQNLWISFKIRIYFTFKSCMCYVTIEGNLESSGRRRLKSPFIAPPEDNLSLTLTFVCSAVHQLSQQVPFQHPRRVGSGLGLGGGAGRRYPAPPRPLSVSVSPSVKWGHTRTLLRTYHLQQHGWT